MNASPFTILETNVHPSNEAIIATIIGRIIGRIHNLLRRMSIRRLMVNKGHIKTRGKKIIQFKMNSKRSVEFHLLAKFMIESRNNIVINA